MTRGLHRVVNHVIIGVMQLPPPDPAVPALAPLLGGDAVHILDAAATGYGFRVESAAATQVRYTPGKAVIVQYRTTVTNNKSGGAEPMLVAASGVTMPAGVREVTDEAGTNIAVWRFPDDPYLPGLAAAVDHSRTADLLHRLGASAGPVRLRTRAYRATRRAVVEAAGEEQSIFMKVLRPLRIGALQRRHEDLAGHLPIPTSLGWSQELGILAMQALGGTTLRTAVESGQRELPSPSAIIELLDRFPAPQPDSATVAVAWKRASDHGRLIGAILPAVRGRLDDLADAIGAADSSDPHILTHGDFHSSQLLIDQGRIVGLVDVDTAGEAQRLDDLATMIGQLATLSVMSDQPAAIDAYMRILMEDFDRRVDPNILRLRIAAVVLGLATGPFRVQLADWPEETLRRIALAEKWAAAAASREIPITP